MKSSIKSVWFLFVLSITCLLTACSQGEPSVEEGKEYQIYYINKNETKLTPINHVTEETETEALISLLIEQLKVNPEDTELRATIADTIELTDYSFNEGRLNIDFGRGYLTMDSTLEVLIRAAIVRTLCQVDEVEYVTFTVAKDALLNKSGSPIGGMNAELFVENTGKEINAYERAELTLYFADKEGKFLRSMKREEVYNSNISLEKLVVDKILSGPTEEEEDVYPTINPDTKALSVTVKDGVCYVNLDRTFETQIYNVTADVAIYSLVNSLVELNNVNKVQISLEGETNLIYKESISLDKPLERNFDIVEQN